MLLGGKKIYMYWGVSLSFFFNSEDTKLPLVFEKNKVVYNGVFVVLIWFCYKYQVGSGIINYFYVYKLLFILKNGWPMQGTR